MVAERVDIVGVQGHGVVPEDLLVGEGPRSYAKAEKGCEVHVVDTVFRQSPIIHRRLLIRVKNHQPLSHIKHE